MVFTVLERRLNTKHELMPREALEYLSLGELLVTHMLGGISRNDVQFAQHLFVQMVDESEQHLAELYRRFEKDFLNAKNSSDKPIVRAFTNYYQYLRFLYDERPAALVDPLIARLPQERASFVRFYEPVQSTNHKRKRKNAPDAFTIFASQVLFYGEAAYSTSSKRRAALVICRRKDTTRAIEKTAYRLLMMEIEQARAERRGETVKPSQIAVTDWFGIKIVTYHPEQAHKIFREVYQNLWLYGFEPNAHQEQRRDKEGHWIPGHQKPGVDDHRIYGAGKDKLIQLKVGPRRVPGKITSTGMWEIDFTDVPNMLVDEMEHIRFRQRQADKLDRLLNQKRAYDRRYREFIAHGEELHALLPNERRRILAPGQYFA